MTEDRGIRKVAILGGGCGAMAAALELTSSPDWRSSLDVTVYQMGWRLGGKGAAGRNAERGSRIEEHGLHIWLGFYNNAFRMIREVYAEANRPLGAGLQNWQDAFTRHDYVVLEDHAGRAWSHWALHLPENDRVPGDDDVPTAIDFFVKALRSGLELLSGRQFRALVEEPRPLPFFPKRIRSALACLHVRTVDALASEAIVDVLRAALWIAEKLDTNPLTGKRRHMKELVWLLARAKLMMRAALEARLERDVEARRLWELFDIATSALTGMVADGVLLHGYHVIDDLDFTDWLVRNGLTEKTRTSAALRVCYDLTFGFSDGRTNHRRFAAGSGLYGLLNMMLAYRGSVMWKMNGGMGDTIFAPIYEVLARRGVKFRFFHKVVDVLAADGPGSGGEPVVEQIVIEEQAALKRAYEPLVTVRNTACWPSEPRWEQLVDGERLRSEGVNFESWWNRTPPHRTLRLKRGRDFDLVVLGTSLAPLRFIAKDLQRRSAPFRAMVEQVKTVETQGIQLWVRPSLRDLGWKTASPILGAYWEPLDTVADLTELLRAEDWGTVGQAPRGLVYLCGPLHCSDEIPLDDPEYPKRQLARVKEYARAFLRQHAHHLWPAGSAPDDPHGLALEHLVGPPGASGEERFEYQFFRANVDPDQRYVLTLPGTNRYRLRSDRSGFANLYLAGDWTRTPFNAGCVEAAVISGLMASRAICGRPARILADALFLEQ